VIESGEGQDFCISFMAVCYREHMSNVIAYCPRGVKPVVQLLARYKLYNYLLSCICDRTPWYDNSIERQTGILFHAKWKTDFISENIDFKFHPSELKAAANQP